MKSKMLSIFSKDKYKMENEIKKKTVEMGFYKSNGPTIYYRNLNIKNSNNDILCLFIDIINSDGSIKKTLTISNDLLSSNISISLKQSHIYPYFDLIFNDNVVYNQQHIFKCNITITFDYLKKKKEIEKMIEYVNESFYDK
jgi:hypothetical protein